jgi:hypothetical protein
VCLLSIMQATLSLLLSMHPLVPLPEPSPLLPYQCRLSEEQYLNNIGRKQAPNFDRDSRRRIYEAFLAYEGVREAC